MKILKHILNGVIWTILGLYLLFILTVSVPAVQQYMGSRLAGMMAKKLGTSVSIGRLEYGFFSHVSLYDVLIKDQQGRDLLKASRLSTRIDLLPLTEGKISIATAQLFGVDARLYKATADSKPNFQFVIDSLASKDTTSTPLNLRINSLIMRRSSVRYDVLDAKETPGILNPSHLHLTDISSHIVLKALTDDSLNVNIKRLSLKEKSGMEVNRLSFHFDGGQHGCRLTDFLLRMPGTEVSLGNTQATYRFHQEKFVPRSLRFTGSILPSTVTLSDLSFLLPSLKTFQSTLSLSSVFKGHDEMMEISDLKVGSTTGDINIDISGMVEQLRQPLPTWQATIRDLRLSAKTVEFISENLQGQRIQVPEALVRLGNIHLTGNVSGKGVSELQAVNHLKTDAGSVDWKMQLDERRQFKGNITTQDFNMKHLLDDDQFGPLTTTIDLSGQLPADGQPVIKADGLVRLLYYKGYAYQNIQLKGLYSARDIHGHVSIDDAHIKGYIDGSLVKNRHQNDIQLTAIVENLEPQAINLTDQWGDARFSGAILADFKAGNINDAVGTLEIQQLSMKSSTESYHLQQLNITSEQTDNGHRVTMLSDFGEAHIMGHFDYKTIAQSITNFVAAKVPTLPGLPKVNPHTNNNFAMKATIRKSDWLEHLLHVPVRLTQPLTIEGMVNDNSQQLAVDCLIPQFYYKDSQYDNCHLSILSPLGTLAYDLSATKRMANGEGMDLQVTGNAFNNQLTATLQWDNHSTERMSGKVTAKGEFTTTFDGRDEATINLASSTMTINNTEWSIHPAHIVYSAKHLSVSNFVIQHEQQFLTLNGVASEHSNESLYVQMRDIDIAYVLSLVDFDAVDFDGMATGGGNLRGIFGNFEADGHLIVNQFEFQHGRMGTLNADVAWNKEEEQIDIRAVADDGEDAQTLINGYVSPERNYIDLDIEAQGTHLDFAQSFLQSFISHIEGHATGSVQLAGPLDAINLTGDLKLSGKAHVSTLGCTYEFRDNLLHLVPNEIEIENFPVYDIYGREAILSGGIHHQELTNLTFDLYVDAENLLAYDFPDFGTDTFYGKVFATGHVGIHGRENSITIDADITPEKGTVYVYNAASPDAINNREFIQWGVSDKGGERKELLIMPYYSLDQTGGEQQKVPATTFRDDLTLNLKINANPDAEVRLLMDAATNDYIVLHGSGMLQATYYNKGGFTMFGTYRVLDGTYGITIQNIIRKNFTFKEDGTVVFGGDPYDATLNLQAQHTVNGVSLSDLNVGRSFANTVRVNCLMNITGQPRQPIVEFDLEMPNVNADEQQMLRSIINSEEEMNQQVIYLLAVGRFYPQGANNATDTENSPSKTSLAMQSLLSGTLSGQINNMLGQIIKSNKWNFGANISTGDEGWNNAEYEGIINGRLLNNRLLINGQFGYRDKATTATPSFIGDFDIRYLLIPSGNLALKVYNQTNDRYFTKSSLNTQGIGVILKKDFDGIPDLFGIKRGKNQESRSKKQEIRTVR